MVQPYGSPDISPGRPPGGQGPPGEVAEPIQRAQVRWARWQAVAALVGIPVALAGALIGAWDPFAASERPGAGAGGDKPAAAGPAGGTPPHPTTAPSPGAAEPGEAQVSAPTVQPLAECLVGRWEATAVAGTVEIPVHEDHTTPGHTVDVSLTRGRLIYANGPSTGYREFQDAVFEGAHEGQAYSVVVNGREQYTWSVRAGRVHTRTTGNRGRVRFYHGDALISDRELGGGDGDPPLGACADAQATLRWSSETQQLARLPT